MVKQNPRAVLFRIGWTELYDGTEHPKGGGGYNSKHRGHEQSNFLPTRGMLYGFVRQPRTFQINLDRIDPNNDGELIEGCTVVWVATHPREGGQRIIGWYKNATVHREYQKGLRDDGLSWNVTCSADDALLIPSRLRTFEIPRKRKGGYGQSNIRYLLDGYGKWTPPYWWNKVTEYVASYHAGNELKDEGVASHAALEHAIEKNTGGQGFQNSSKVRIAIEHYAMRLAEREMRNPGWETVDASAYKTQSYDLLMRKGSRSLKVEVKGTTGDGSRILITRGEVEEASTDPKQYAVVVISGIKVEGKRNPRCRGGSFHELRPFNPSSASLTPIAYRMKVQ